MDKSITDKKTRGDLKTRIGRLRRNIDKIDKEIMGLINQRLSLAKQIGNLKKQGDIQITDGDREKEIMNRLLAKNNGLLSDSGLRNIFGAVIAEGRRVQKKDRGPK